MQYILVNYVLNFKIINIIGILISCVITSTLFVTEVRDRTLEQLLLLSAHLFTMRFIILLYIFQFVM